jgi:hypothetical protein
MSISYLFGQDAFLPEGLSTLDPDSLLLLIAIAAIICDSCNTNEERKLLPARQSYD